MWIDLYEDSLPHDGFGLSYQIYQIRLLHSNGMSTDEAMDVRIDGKRERHKLDNINLCIGLGLYKLLQQGKKQISRCS